MNLRETATLPLCGLKNLRIIPSVRFFCGILLSSVVFVSSIIRNSETLFSDLTRHGRVQIRELLEETELKIEVHNETTK